MGQEDQESAVLLAMRELKTGMMLGMVVPRKGLAESWIERRVAQFMNSFGYKKVLLRSDNENSIVALRKMIIKLCDAEVIDEDSIKGESQTNGLAEVGVKIIEGIVRTLKIDLEKNMKKAVDNKSVALAWLVEHSCVVYNRCTVCSDGRTPWQRAYGKAASLPLVPFGEKVLYKKLKATGDKKNSLEPRFSYGIYLGSRPKSGEHYIGVEEGVIRCRDVRRLAEDKRYDVEMLEKIKGTPWSPLGGDAMLEVPTNIKTETLRPDENDEYRPDINIKKMMITKEDIKKFGKSERCGGCRAVTGGQGQRQSHTDECRKRIESELAKDPVGAERVERNRRRVLEQLGGEVERRVKHDVAKTKTTDDVTSKMTDDVPMSSPGPAASSGAPSSSSSSSSSPGGRCEVGINGSRNRPFGDPLSCEEEGLSFKS